MSSSFYGSYTYKKPTIIEPYVESLDSTGVRINYGYTSNGGAKTTWTLYFGTTSNPTTVVLQGFDYPDKSWFGWDYEYGLAPDTAYYFKYCAENVAGKTCSQVYGFRTPPAGTTPTVTTRAVTSILTTSATCEGRVVSDGGSPVTTRGICWNTTGNPTILDNKQTSGSGTGTFPIYLSGLSPNTTYYVRAYATNSIGTGYGTVVSFTTAAISTIPIVTTAPITNITTNSAIGGGNVTNQGSSAVTARGICASSNPNPTISGYHTVDGAGLGTFSSNITGFTELSPNTTYYVRAYATNSAGTGYGAEISFTTNSACVAPTVSLATISGITPTTADTVLTIVSNGGCTVLVSSIEWSVNPDFSGEHVSSGPNTTGSYTITGLLPSTTYYVRGYAANNTGTGYSVTQSFTTATVSASLPSVSTNNVTSILTTTALSGGNVMNDGGALVTARGIQWSLTSDFSSISGSAPSGSGTGSFTATLTGLQAETFYYVRAYAINSTGTAYGNVVSFTTVAVPFVQLVNLGIERPTFIMAYGKVLNDGGHPITEVGFVISLTSTNSNPQIGGTGVSKVAVSGVSLNVTYGAALAGLTCGNNYTINAYATNSIGTSYGTKLTGNANSLSIPLRNLFYYASWLDGFVDLTASNTYTAATILKSELQNSPNNTLSNSARIESIGVSNPVYSAEVSCVKILHNTYRVVNVGGVYYIIHIDSAGIIDFVE